MIFNRIFNRGAMKPSIYSNITDIRINQPSISSLSQYKTFVSLFLLLIVSLVTTNAHAANSVLYEIRYNPILAGETEVEFVFDTALAAAPVVQVLNKPARFKMEIPNASFEKYLSNIPVSLAGIDKIVTEQIGNNLEVEIFLDSLKIYQTRFSGTKFNIHISDNAGFSEVVESQKDKSKFINRIQAIDFRRGDDNSGRALVFLKTKTAAVNVTEARKKLILDFHNTEILEDLLYNMDVSDFKTVVNDIETFREPTKTRVEISMREDFSYQYQQIDNIFSIDIKKKETENNPLENETYTGSPISLNFQDISVRTVLQIIADYNGFNLVTSDTVSGNVTLRLDGVPWDQALDMILKVKGLDKRMDGSILLIAPSAEIAEREAKELESKQQVSNLSPLYSEFIQINYAKAQQISSMLNNEGTKLISDRGAISIDERTNTLLIKDTEESIKNIRKLVAILDIPVKQVTIESRIVTVNDNISEEIGVRWGFSDKQNQNGVAGTLEGANSIASGQIPSLSNRLNVNLPVSGAAGSIGFSVARLNDGTILDLELSALETENQGEIIASPRITTANQKTAYIEQGTEIPFVQASSSGATAVTFKKAVLSLEVTPQITPDNKIILDLIITQDTRGDNVPTATGNAVAINTQEIGTQVLVDNGETIVLGGIYQQQLLSDEKKVPILGDIPYLGRLFRSSREYNEKKELLIFVTPRIVTEKL